MLSLLYVSCLIFFLINLVWWFPIFLFPWIRVEVNFTIRTTFIRIWTLFSKKLLLGELPAIIFTINVFYINSIFFLIYFLSLHSSNHHHFFQVTRARIKGRDTERNITEMQKLLFKVSSIKTRGNQNVYSVPPRITTANDVSVRRCRKGIGDVPSPRCHQIWTRSSFCKYNLYSSRKFDVVLFLSLGSLMNTSLKLVLPVILYQV